MVLFGMRTITFCLVGTSPLLLHKICEHQKRDQVTSTGGDPSTEAAQAMYRNEKGAPAIPASWLSDAMRAACSHLEDGGRRLSYSRIASTLCFAAKSFVLRNTDNREPSWSAYESIQHRKPGSKTMVVVVAPQFSDWMVDVVVNVYGDYPDTSLLERIFNQMGRMGIGLFHPPKKNFGQFRVPECRVEEDQIGTPVL